MNQQFSNLSRYTRQMAFPPLGRQGQEKLRSGRVLLAGVGGLGSWTAELLTRAGVGFLRVVDADTVEISNIHRQCLYAEADAGKFKVHAAAERLKNINSEVVIEAVPTRLERQNIESLAGDIDLILDGTDNFAARFLVNDYAVKSGRPWIFVGVMGAEGQTMTVLPGETPCLRCVYEQPPPEPGEAAQAPPILPPVVSTLASFQAMEAMKILSGRPQAANPYLLKIDLWTNRFQRIDVRTACAEINCRCCKRKVFEFLQT